MNITKTYLFKLNYKHYSLLGIALFAFIIWFFFIRLPFTYSAESIAGRVVDADTGQPIEDAIVIAVWELKRGFGMEGSIIAGHMHIAEVLTDKDGYYFIDGWGPKKRPGKAYLSHNAPKLVIFKDGYDFFAKGNRYDSIFKDNRRESVHKSSWNMATIKLKKFKGSLEDYYRRLSKVNIALASVTDRIMGAGDCDWMNIPRIIIIFENYYQKLKQSGKRSSLITPLDVLVKRNRCAVNSKEDFILEHSR